MKASGARPVDRAEASWRLHLIDRFQARLGTDSGILPRLLGERTVPLVRFPVHLRLIADGGPVVTVVVVGEGASVGTEEPVLNCVRYGVLAVPGDVIRSESDDRASDHSAWFGPRSENTLDRGCGHENTVVPPPVPLDEVTFTLFTGDEFSFDSTTDQFTLAHL